MGEWGSGEMGKWGISTKKPQHPPQRARSDHPNTLKPQNPKTPTPQLSVFSLYNSLKCPCSIFQ
ncbi:hypothetical protein MTo_01812 [Microcystis aeruginosa NIES-1211]|nr:hypothetical protein MTo_01812 [Microcystis aeruginosa NIES-1211]GCA83249.1 hypothetical protein MiHa_01208 [Microcystis aeruginosa NIES-2522]GCA86978.1 hypothetical protein MiTa_00302 [Microcystis aeruginosa NIES-4264]